MQQLVDYVVGKADICCVRSKDASIGKWYSLVLLKAKPDVAMRQLVIRTSTTEDEIELAVQDSGAGLKEEEAAQVFEPLYTTKPHGIGMGLAINRTIIEAHGGRTWSRPNPTGGVTFYVNFPISEKAKSRDRSRT